MLETEYEDLSDNDEDTRVKIIASTLQDLPAGRVIGVLVDAEPENAKAERYFRKIKALCPGAEKIGIGFGPTSGSTLLTIRRVS